MKTIWFQFAVINLLFLQILCNSDAKNRIISDPIVDCENIDSLKIMVMSFDFSGDVNKGLIECVIESRDSVLFDFVYTSLSNEKRKFLTDRLLLITSIYSGNTYAFKKLLPFNKSIINYTPYFKPLAEHILKFCGQIDESHDITESPISKMDSLAGIKMLDEYFKYDSINSPNLEKQLRWPILFSAIHSPKASRYLIEKGANVNSKFSESGYRDIYYLEAYMNRIIAPDFVIVFEEEEYSAVSQSFYLERLEIFDMIIEREGTLGGKEDPYLYFLKKAINFDQFLLVRLLISRYYSKYKRLDRRILLEYIELSEDERVKDYVSRMLLN